MMVRRLVGYICKEALLENDLFSGDEFEVKRVNKMHNKLI